jgi:Flp pilus assembly pilin Flp
MGSMKFIRWFAAEESGQTITEYVLLISFILFAVLGVAAGYGKKFAGVTNTVNSNLVDAANSAYSGACRQESNCKPVQHGTGNHKILVSSK